MEQPAAPSDDKLEALQQRIGYRFHSPALLACAVTHASARGSGRLSNERLEFLGDAVVGLVVSDHLYREMPGMSEGDMTVLKSAVVSRRTMARVGREMKLTDALEVDEGLKQRSRYPVSMVANCFEAMVGAIYMDGGLEQAAAFVLRTLGPEIGVVRDGGSPNCKSVFQELVQANGKGAPSYNVLRCDGPDHDRRYLVAVLVNGEEWGKGAGATKKAAEQEAARSALDQRFPGWLSRPAS